MSGRDEQKDRRGFIYVIFSEHTYRCKIGRTIKPEQRLKQVRLMSPYRLIFGGYYLTDDVYAHERFWHIKFANRRVHGEWFHLRPDEELLLLLAIMNKAYETLLEDELAQMLNDGDEQRVAKNFHRRMSRRIKKSQAERTEATFRFRPRRSSRNSSSYDSVSAEEIKAKLDALLLELDTLGR